MDPFPLFQPACLTVTEINRYLKQMLESDEILQDVWVRGEVSNFSRPASGHLYFTLKDSSAALRCVMWRNAAQRLNVPMRDGAAVEAHGSISLYESGGQLQLYVDTLRPAGEGALFQAFLRLKARLEAEGLFDPERKRPIPDFPRVIGVVTSPTGAAFQDILNCLRRRYPLAEVVLSPCPVQGDDAPPKIVAALELLNRAARPDVILLARGGGSLEDLWAFNDERVARAVVASQAPVITGVGHEVDFTIVDFASDLRAPTPTAAAEMATPNRADLAIDLGALTGRLARAAGDLIDAQRWNLGDRRARLQRASPLSIVLNNRQRLDDTARRAGRALLHASQLRRLRLAGLSAQLVSLSPEGVLRRGYAILLRQADGRLVTSVAQARPGDDLRARLSDGSIDIRVTASGETSHDGQ